MKIAAYSSYKSTASNWLDAIPAHWSVVPLKRIVAIPITDGPHETPEFVPEGVPFASVEAVWDGKVHLSSVRGYISEEAQHLYSKKYRPKKDDIFIVKSGSTTGKIAIVDFDDEFNVWSPLAAVRCNPVDACPKFIFYALSSSYFQRLIQVFWSFGTQPNIGMGILGNLPAVLPPIEEQQAIVRFLEIQTARIDTLLEKKQQLIAKLKEKRSALIARTVTRGLPPDAAKAAGLEPHPVMKDACVEWLDDVPAHWGVTRLGFLCEKIGSGKTPHGGADVYVDEGIMFLRSQNIYDEGLMLDDVVYISEEIDNDMQGTRVKPRDILLNVTGASLGRTCIVPTAFVNANVNQHVCIIRLADLNLSSFIAWVIKAPFIKAQIEAIQSGAAREGLNFGQISKLALALPPPDEQRAIATYLDRETSRIDQLTAKVEAAISRLIEYRQALITSAVTGKIDVRARTVG
ncbi:MAG: restriction endonuclease subunit S [Gallionella sp.]